ncbi:MAG: hypothetical protein KDB46_05720 [Solirubrobacterales bacterium]|nr:hypothetical protein [Solirubrobacterales bacterium]
MIGKRFRYEYGAQPLHLIAVATSLLLCAYAIFRVGGIPGGGKVLIWLVAAALLHDLVALPLYSGLFALTHGAADRTIPDRASMLMALNHVRVPAAISLLLLVVYAPLILRIDPDRYEATTGISLDPYLGRWLLISAALFLISGIAYAIRLRRGAPAVAADPPPVADGPGEHRTGGALAAAGWFTVALAGLATAWVVATVIVGLVTNGL